MKRFARSFIASATIFGFFALMPLPALAAIISIVSSPPQLSVGDTVFVDLKADLAPNEILSAFDIKLTFNESAFIFLSSSFVDPTTAVNQLDLPEADSFGFIGDALYIGGGLIDIFGASGNSDSVLEGDQANDFVFARIEFVAMTEIASAVFAFDISNPNQAFLGADFADLPIRFAPSLTSVTVGSSILVPEPGVMWLLLAAMPAAMLRSCRPRRATRSA